MTDAHVPMELTAETRRVVANFLTSMRVGTDQAVYEKAKAAFEAHVAALPEAEATQAALNVAVGLMTGVDP